MNTKTQTANAAFTSQAEFLEQVAAQWQQAVVNEDSISLFLIDVDRFDEIRHKAGCVRKLITALDEILNRDTDYICLFSRKKIMFLTSSMTYRQTRQLAERIHQVVAALALRLTEGDDTTAQVTVSIGHLTYAPVEDGSYGILDIISNVIKLCRQARHAGGNCSRTRLHSRVLR